MVLFRIEIDKVKGHTLKAPSELQDLTIAQATLSRCATPKSQCLNQYALIAVSDQPKPVLQITTPDMRNDPS